MSFEVATRFGQWSPRTHRNPCEDEQRDAGGHPQQAVAQSTQQQTGEQRVPPSHHVTPAALPGEWHTTTNWTWFFTGHSEERLQVFSTITWRKVQIWPMMIMDSFFWSLTFKDPKTEQPMMLYKPLLDYRPPPLALTLTYTPIWRNNRIRTNWVYCVLYVTGWAYHRDQAVPVSVHLLGFSCSAQGNRQMTPYPFNLSHDPWELNQFSVAVGGSRETWRAETLESEASLVAECLSMFE